MIAVLAEESSGLSCLMVMVNIELTVSTISVWSVADVTGVILLFQLLFIPFLTHTIRLTQVKVTTVFLVV